MDRGMFSKPVRHRTEVHRRPSHNNAEVHRLLQHFESVGCALTPRFLGFTEDEAERLSFIEGTTGYPPLSATIRSEEVLINVARAIRVVHDASQGFVPLVEATWNGYELARPADIDCIGHHDLAPWNFVFDGTNVRGIIDWDAAGPSNRIWDLSYAAYQFVPFHPTGSLGGWGWEIEPDRPRRLRLFLDAYGYDISPAELVDAAITRTYSMGAFIDREVARGNPAFDVHAKGNYAQAYFRATSHLIEMRSSLLI